MAYAIKDHMGMLVAGFSEEHMIVQSTREPSYVKRFKTQRAAERWAERYADCGYGLPRYEIVEAPDAR